MKSKKQENKLQIVDPKIVVSEMEEKMPSWVKKMSDKEDMANAMYATGQEMLLVVIDTLQRYHGFTDEDIRKFNKELEDVLTGVKEFEEHGLNILSPHSVGVVGEKIEKIGIVGLLGEIANTRLLKERMIKVGLEYPISLQATPFIKQITEKKK